METKTYPSYAALRDLLQESFTDIGHVASHWSQLYEGGSRLVIIIDEQEQIDRINELNLKGEFCTIKRRDGAAHWEDKGFVTPRDYATLEELKKDFFEQHTRYDGDNWFFNTENDYKEHFTNDDGEFDANGNSFQGEGMYDQYGSVILNKGGLRYSEDVWTYAVGFVVDQDAMIDEDSDEKEFRIFGEGRGSGVSMDDVRKGRI